MSTSKNLSLYSPLSLVANKLECLSPAKKINLTNVTGSQQQHRQRQALRRRTPQPDPRGGRPQRVLGAGNERLQRERKMRQSGNAECVKE
jgi:hypothetical protein